MPKQFQKNPSILDKTTWEIFPLSCPLSYATKLFPKRRLCGKKTPSPNSMLLPTNAQGSGFLLNTQQHCFQGKGEREEPVQLRFLEKCCPSIQFSQQFCPRLHSVLFICCIELWTKAVFSSDPAFLKNIVVLGDPKLNPVTGQIGRIAGNDSHRNRWKRIIKSLGYSKNIRYAFAAHIKPQLSFFPLA